MEGFFTGELPGTVNAAIAEALPSGDPLDRPDFDAIDYINAKFPSEQAALEALEPFLAQVTNEIGTLDNEISVAIEEQSRAGEQATNDIQEAQAAIRELFEKIKDITNKAEQSELMVQEICRDIKQLDFAKRHLQTTITALKRLHMLVSAVDQLSFMAKQHHYKEAANLVDAVRQLATHFDGYQQIPKIAEIRHTIDSINTQLNDQISRAFSEISDMASGVAEPGQLRRDDAAPGSFKSLAEACMVVDALGPEARKVHVDEFCRKQLEPYAGAFPKGGEWSSLEHVERRFAWFRRSLKQVDDRFDGVFPPTWRVQHCLLMAFLQQTRQHILEILEAGGPESENVTVLLKALQKTLLFEKEMQPRFEPEAALHHQNSAHDLLTRTPTTYNSPPRHDSQFASLAKDGKAVEGKKVHDATVLNICGMISGVFDPFMSPYIELERKNMEEMIAKAVEGDQVDRNLESAKLPVFTSSVEIFVYIKKAIKRCTALTTSTTFFTLAKEFKACLAKYAKILRSKLPPPSARTLGEGGEVDVCYIINTAEYCTDTVPQLEDMVKAKIDLSYAESINFSAEADLFHETITAAVKSLVGALEAKFEPALRSMGSFNWATCEEVGEESGYVRVINDAIRAYVPPVRALLSNVYFRNFCDKFAQSFLPAYLSAIVRLKRINEMGTQQLLLDVYNLKTLMLQLPIIGQQASTAPGAEPTPIPASYTKYVSKQMAKIDSVLKLVLTSNDMLAERFKIMWPDGEAQDLQAIMNLKGMSKKEQQHVMDAVGLEYVAAPGEAGNTNEGGNKSAAPGGHPPGGKGPSASGASVMGPGGLSMPSMSMPPVASLASGKVTNALKTNIKALGDDLGKAFQR